MTDRVKAALEAEIRKLYRAYVSLLELGRNRIVSLGGTCDAVDVMEDGDPALRSARALLALSGERSDEWRDISTAPKDGTHIIVANSKNQFYLPATVHWFDGGWHLSVNQRGEYSEYIWGAPTHWQSLPTPPAPGKGE